jgi:redox-sensitive bicupin YhaK (pirin superfamily)
LTNGDGYLFRAGWRSACAPEEKTMVVVRPSTERGRSQLDWLDSQHTFSFDQYYDPQHMSFGPLRVINEDVIEAGGGFGTHPHRDMEIITYVIEGELKHQDSLGNGSVIRPGEIQKMSAGTGILHSEYNASKEKPVHLLQIWIVPKTRNLKPKYEQEAFQLNKGELKLLGSADGKGLVTIEQDVKLYGASMEPGTTIVHALAKNTEVWIQMVKGTCSVNGQEVVAGDGAAVTEGSEIKISANKLSELLLFEIGKD